MADRKPIGYAPVFAPEGVATAAIMSCRECGLVLSGMGGPRNVLCPVCTVDEITRTECPQQGTPK